jgi:SAM-dependent methyltransferase
MRYPAVHSRMPRWLRRHVLHFEAAIEDAVVKFAAALPEGALVLDAGAGEGAYKAYFKKQRYCGIDLAIGDYSWNYSGLDALADLTNLPFPSDCFDACVNIVTLEHVREPGAVLAELTRILKPGGRVLMIVPQEWEVHQMPHDYYRYTRYGMRYLMDKAGLHGVHVYPVGGYFRLVSRRLLNGLQFFRGFWVVPAALLLTPPALVLPLFEFLDHDRNFTLGYICVAVKK